MSELSRRNFLTVAGALAVGGGISVGDTLAANDPIRKTGDGRQPGL
jgi:hypothetical protein